jgi:hypothetical protein
VWQLGRLQSIYDAVNDLLPGAVGEQRRRPGVNG